LISESSPLSPANIYAEQKLEAETSLQRLFELEASRLCIIRVFSVLDWDVAPFTLGGAIKKLVDSEFILSNSSDVRDFLTPKQVAGAVYEISSAKNASGVFNLSSGKATSVGVAVNYLLKLENIKVSEGALIEGNSTIPSIVGDNSKLKSLLPKLTLDWAPNRRRTIVGNE
jgi:nucleoside-diphosphate-sugar epimerase